MRQSIPRTSLTRRTNTRSKYNAKKVVIDNIKFDSKAEAARLQSKLNWFEKFYGKYFAKGELE
ncbi:DUF1064 domain-containing protein [Listeria monocytogenes]|nr:DUF1064 domain-containing protein [Listeria monocytogenes]